MSRVRLKDVCASITDGEHGSVPATSNSGYYLLSAKNIIDGKVILGSIEREISQEDFLKIRKRTSLEKGDILITTTGTIGNIGIVENCSNYDFNRDVGIFKCKTDVLLPRYLYYVLLSDYVQTKIRHNSKGGTQKHIYIHDLEDIEIELPEIEEQKRVLNTLGKIDDKIHKNREINDYLEEMAKTIYDYWFVQFDFPDEKGNPYKSSNGEMIYTDDHILPKGWKICKIRDIISSICTGLNPRDNFSLGSGNIKYITVKNLTTKGTLDFTGCDTIDESARTIIHNRSDIQIGDILFASIAPLGRCYLIQEEPTNWDINESVFSIRANVDVVTPTFLYLYFMSDAFIKQATSSSTGSIFKGIRINTLLDTELCVPPLSVITQFEDKLASMLPLKSKCFEEIQKLTNLRDWLLPMLMNGQATIED